MRGLAVGLLLSLPTSAFAEQAPISQMFYGTVDHDSVTMYCDAPNGNQLHCSFTQVMVSRAGNKEEFEASLAAQVDSALAEAKKDTKTCQSMAAMSEAIRTGIAPEAADIDRAVFEKHMREAPQGEKDDMIALMDQMSAFCKNPNRKSAEALLRTGNDRDLRTCKVWTNTYEQTFVSSDFGKSWIANQGPTGECGLVVISRLQRTKDEGIAADAGLWTYTTQKVVTNKDAKQLGVMDCSGLDERIYFYDWKSKEHFLNCDYVRFGF